MGMVEPQAPRAGLMSRVAGMLFRPTRTWEVVADEPASLLGLFKGYAAPLAAIPALCGLVGQLTFGSGMAGVGIRPSPQSAVAGAATDYLLTLLGVWLLALGINALAPLFGGRRDLTQAAKASVYSGTALWAAGVFALYPALGWLAGILAGLYSLYVLSLALPRLMDAPLERALAYFVTVLLLALLLLAAISFTSARVRDAVGGPLSVIGGRLSPDM